MHLYDRKVREQRALVDYATGKWSSRPDRAVWVRDLIRECKEAGLAVFFKQRLVRRGMWEPIYVRPHRLACECPRSPYLVQRQSSIGPERAREAHQHRCASACTTRLLGRKANLLLVRTKEEIISRVRHQLSLAHHARARGNSSS